METQKLELYTGRPLRRLVEGVAILGGITTLAVAAFVFVDVILRAAGMPIFGGRDITTVALTVIIACGLASGATHGIHLSIDALANVLGPWARRIQKMIADVISLIVLIILTWRSYLGGNEAAEFGDKTMLLSIPHGPFYYALSAGLALYALVVAVDLFAQLRGSKEDFADAS